MAQREKMNPDYIVYFVPNRKNAYWSRIGVAFKHKDDKGLNIEHDFLPVGEGRLVLRDFDEVMKNKNENEGQVNKESA